MELEGGGGRRGGGEMNKQLQAQPPHQKCPRCDSFNTKFCYYNNYSLTQPRFFCKTCRRYWTQGGTLRNVPVGGGCRKGKRAKNSSLAASSSNSSGNSSLSQQPQLPSTMQQTVALSAKDSSSIMASLSSGVPFYQGGGSGGGLGFMSSFPAFNPMNPSSSSPNPFDQSLNVGGVGSSNLGLLQGFNLAATLGNSSQGQNRPSQFFQMGSGGNGMFNSEQQGLNLISQTGMVNTTSAVSAANAVVAANNDNWPQSFMSNGNNINSVSDPTLNWSNINTTSIVGVNSDGNGAGVGVGAGVGGSGSGAGGVSSSLVAPNQWADMSGFNPPQ